MQVGVPGSGVVQLVDGDGEADLEVDGAGAGVEMGEKPVLRLNDGVGVFVGDGFGVVGTAAVLTPPVTSCFVAIGRFALPAR